MGERQVTVAAIMIAATVSFAGCSPGPTVSPTSTPLSTEELAFAEAEATYRAYIAAANEWTTDVSSLPSPSSFLVGDALTSSEDTARYLAKKGLRLTGSTTVRWTAPRVASSHEATITVCLDYSATRVIDAHGKDVTPPDRPDTGALDVTVKETNSGPRISTSKVSEQAC